MAHQSKNLVVTGASRGIGAATARLAGRRGYAVSVNYRKDEAGAEAVVADIKAAGGRSMAIQADVGNESDVVAMFDQTVSAFGPLGGLVNNAGVSGGRRSVEDMTLTSLQDVFATNVFGAFLCGREAIRRMSSVAGGGAIVNVSSRAAATGGNRLTHYAASKAAIEAFTRGFAREAAAADVRVNAVSPGVIATDLNSDDAPLDIPMGRAGTPDEVAEVNLVAVVGCGVLCHRVGRSRSWIM